TDVSVAMSCRPHRLGELWNDLEHVADNAVVGDLEDRRFLILVDRDDGLRRSHAGEMLDRARDADSHVKLRAHLPSGLTDLIAVRTPAVVGHGTCRADGRVAECRRQILE